jgi:addiction module HigA family antidote
VPAERLPPTPPGEVLLEDFLTPLKISQYKLAKEISVPRRRINEIVQGKRAVTADTAIRLARYFGVSDRFWLNLQTRYDIEVTRDRLGDRLEQEVRGRPRYYPPALACRGRSMLVQLPDGRIARITRSWYRRATKSEREEVFEAIFAYWQAQGKHEAFLDYLEGRLAEEKQKKASRKRRR